MANPIFISAMAKARRTMRRHQQLPPSARLPMWRLLAGEVAYLAQAAARRRQVVAALAVAVLVTVGLSPATPGPVATPWLRLLLGAVAATAAVWAVPWVLSQPGPAGQAPLWQQTISGISMVLLAAITLATAAWLLAMIVASLF